MKCKFTLFITALLILICCIGSASAAEDISDDALSTDSDLDVVEQADDATLEINNEEQTVLSGTPQSVSTWADLKNYSMKTDADYEITVADGTYNVGSDQVVFGNNAKIIGSGNTVITGGDSSVTTFTGTGKSITFSNLIFRNMNSNMVIHLIDSDSSKIENCVFENIVTSTSGQKSVVYNNGGYMNISNCNFTNCNTTYGVITNHKTATTTFMDVENCRFVNNRASVEPGAINNCGIMNVTDSVFNYNRATWWAGAIHTHANAKSIIKRSSFNGNVAGWNGGALYTYANLEVYDSNFTNNNCTTNAGGGAIGASNYFFASVKYNVKVKNCRFEGNKNLASGGHGGAIAAMNGGTLNVQDSTFIHNCAEIGQAISGYNTNEYANISEGNAKLVIKNNQFINHTCNDNDTVYIGGDHYTFSGNTFINSPQTHYNNLNTYNNILNPVILSKSNYEPILGVASEDLIQSGQSGEFYVDASSGNEWDYEQIADAIMEGDDDAENYGTSPNSALTTLDDLDYFLLWIQDFDSGDYSTFYIADGEYQLNSPILGFMTLVGTGDNVVIKDVSVESSKTELNSRTIRDNVTFVNIIFENFKKIDDFDCTFINCTFRNTAIDFCNDRDNYVFVPFNGGDDTHPDWRSAPVFNVTLTNCKFTGVTGDYVINVHRYVNLVVNDCNFTDCAVDSIVVTKANCSAEKALYDVEVNKFSPDGVNMSNINIVGSTFKGVLKAQKDTEYSVEKISGFDVTANTIEDGNNIYLNATDVKSPVETKLTINSTEKGIIVITVVDNENKPIANLEVKYSINDGANSTNTTGADGTISIPVTGEGEIKAYFEGNESYLKSEGSYKYNFTETTPAGNGTSGNGTSGNGTSGNGTSTNTGKTTTNTPKVTKKATKITAKKATFKAKKKTKKYTIVLKAGKTAVKKVKVTLKVGKKTYKATTNSKGKATFKITKLNKKGKYNAVIKFAGNKNFKPTSKKVKITVKK
ncbi:hypothetical protein [Methanobrevibacter thaueri]|uniref:hypothetical protein n=1 Tax=Methanobrevibacter thaueri TaxID=190975 RepID=UPI00386A9C98